MMEWLLALGSAAAALKLSSAPTADSELKIKLDKVDADEIALEAKQIGEMR